MYSELRVNDLYFGIADTGLDKRLERLFRLRASYNGQKHLRTNIRLREKLYLKKKVFLHSP